MTYTKECLCRQRVAVVVRENLTPIMESKKPTLSSVIPPFHPASLQFLPQVIQLLFRLDLLLLPWI